MDYQPIITSKRTGNQWTATATINGDDIGSCTSKSRDYAEKEARKAGEHLRRYHAATATDTTTKVGSIGYVGTINGLVPAITEHLQAAAAKAGRRMVMSMGVVLLFAGACTQRPATSDPTATKRPSLLQRADARHELADPLPTRHGKYDWYYVD